MPRRITLLLYLFIAQAPAQAPARAEPALPAQLGLAQALDAFRQHGFDLLIADATTEGAEADVAAAGASANPALSVSYGRSFYYTCHAAGGCATPPGALAVQLSDQAAITDALSGKRQLRGDVARAALRAARLGRSDAERTLRFQVKAQFVQLLLAQNVREFADETARASALMLDKTEKQRAADKIQRPDLLRVKVAKLEAEQAADQARAQVRKARAQLAFLLGVRGAAPELTAVEPGLAHYRALPSLDHDTLLAQALAARPDVAAQREQIAGADADVALQRRQRFPDLAITLGYVQQGTSDGAVSPPTVSLGLSAPIPLLYRQQGEIGRAVANARLQRLTDDKLRASVVNDFEQAYADVLGAQTLVRRMEDGELLATARQARDDIQLLYEKGSAQLTDYLLALGTYISTQLEYLDDVAGYWTAVFALEQAIGKELL